VSSRHRGGVSGVRQKKDLAFQQLEMDTLSFDAAKTNEKMNNTTKVLTPCNAFTSAGLLTSSF
jgi:hypothetical protein